MKLLKIPSTAFWLRSEFLRARALQTETAKRDAGPDDIVIDCGDDVICDNCNADIPDDPELINVVEFGRRVVCDPCFQRLYARDEVTYRTIHESD